MLCNFIGTNHVLPVRDTIATINHIIHLNKSAVLYLNLSVFFLYIYTAPTRSYLSLLNTWSRYIYFDKYRVILTYCPLVVLFFCCSDISVWITNTNCYKYSCCSEMSSLTTSMDKNCIVTVLKYKTLVGYGEKGKMTEGEACPALLMCST